MNQEKIGKFISTMRKKKDLTQEQLAEKLNVSKNAVSKWERGLNLPDASIMQDVCSILDISLNELFAGEKLNKDEQIKHSEQTIINILKNQKHRNKIYKICLSILIVFVLIIIGRFTLIKMGYIMDDNLKYTQVYIAEYGDVKGNVDINSFGKKNIAFDIGANKYGYAVFKNPNKAFNRLKKDYSKRNDLIKSVIDSQETFIFFFNLLRRIRKELPRIWNNSEICALLKSIRNKRMICISSSESTG